MPEDLTAEEFLELTEGRNVPVVQMDRMISGAAADTVLAENIAATLSPMPASRPGKPHRAVTPNIRPRRRKAAQGLKTPLWHGLTSVLKDSAVIR